MNGMVGNDLDAPGRWGKYVVAALICQGAVTLLLRGAPQQAFIKAAPLEVEIVTSAVSPAPATAGPAAAAPLTTAKAALPVQSAAAQPMHPLAREPKLAAPVAQTAPAPKTEPPRAAVAAPASSVQPVAAVPSAGQAGRAVSPAASPSPASQAVAAPASGSAAVMAGEVLTRARPNYLHNPPPPYPPLAKRRGLTGAVVLKVLVGREGVAKEVSVRSSSGHALLDQAAVSTVAGWRFSPARRGDVSVESWVDVPIRFELNRVEGG